MNEQLLLREARVMQEEMIAMRRDFHMNPELGTQEYRTSGIVEKFLKALGIETEVICGTAVVGILRGGKDGATVALRADLDALAVQDRKTCDYASKNEGVMHACGHDMHTTALLFAAKLLQAHREELCGTVKFFFEPNEEGGGYAKKMIEQGVMDKPKVDAVFALHQSMDAPVGTICCREGQMSSASGRFTIDVYGRPAHGAEPHNGVDAIAAGCQIVLALQQCVSRRSNPHDATVLTVGTFHAGEVRNAICSHAHISGIHRTPTLEAREQMNEWIKTTAVEIGRAMGAEVEVGIDNGAACMINDEAMTALVRTTARQMLGEENVLREGGLPVTIAEDCGEFLSRAAGCYFNVGVANPAKGITAPAHSNLFDIDENALPVGAAMFAAVAANYLESAKK